MTIVAEKRALNILSVSSEFLFDRYVRVGEQKRKIFREDLSVKYETMKEIVYRENMKMKLCAKRMAIVVENVALIILSVFGGVLCDSLSIFKTE